MPVVLQGINIEEYFLDLFKVIKNKQFYTTIRNIKNKIQQIFLSCDNEKWTPFVEDRLSLTGCIVGSKLNVNVKKLHAMFHRRSNISGKKFARKPRPGGVTEKIS